MKSAELFDTLKQRPVAEKYVPVKASFEGKFTDKRKEKENESAFNINQIMDYVGVVKDTTKPAIPMNITPVNKATKRKKTEIENVVGPKMTAVVQQVKTYNGEDVVMDGKTLELSNRLPKAAVPTNIQDFYWLNNRKQFVSFITNYLKDKYKNEIDHVSEQTCDSIFGNKDKDKDKDNDDKNDFSLLTHQKIIRDYMNLFTPYRGLLIYHGLGLGKTCTSIAIAESMKSTKDIIVMAPAFLLDSYQTQLKKCGDIMYRKNQYWEWIPLSNRIPEREKVMDTLSRVLSIRKPDFEKFVKKHQGIFLINVNKRGPTILNDNEDKILDEQIDLMIKGKYIIFSYNGLSRKKYEEYTIKYSPEGSKNMFDNKVVIIDEAHNLVSRIINKLDKQKPNSKGAATEDPSVRANIQPPNQKEQLEAVKKVSLELSNLFIDLRKMYGEKKANQGPELVVLNNSIANKEREIKAFLKKQTTYDVLTDKEKKDIKDQEKISNPDFLNKVITRLQSSDQLHIKLKTVTPLSLQMYNDLMTAKNARVVMLSGTPIINRAHEMGIMFNMLRGTVKSWTFKFNKQLTDKQIDMVMKARLDIDFFDYNSTTSQLTITRNPFGFMNTFQQGEGNRDLYIGMTNNQTYTRNKYTDTDEDFLKEFKTKLQKKSKEGLPSFDLIQTTERKLLPDTSDEFNKLYIHDDKGKLTLKDKRRLEVRLLGLTSFFTTLQQGLLPDYNENTDFVVVECVMPNYQYEVYKPMNEKENKMNQQMSKKPGSDTDSSTYKVFTRLICDYAVPDRPYPGDFREGSKDEEQDDNPESWLQEVVEREDNANVDNMDNANDADADVDAILDKAGGEMYDQAINAVLKRMLNNKEEYFSLQNLENKYSPKYYALITNIKSSTNVGLNLVYSFFKTLEGLTLLGYAMQYNGFAKLEVKNNRIFLNDKSPDNWERLDIKKPKFAVYKGDKNERAIIQNIYNSNWTDLAPELINDLTLLFNENRNADYSTETADNNNFGEIIKVFMITSSGSEGINLNNTRYVHILEPHWHHVRIEQVIGRARRLCSHRALPPEFRNVKVFFYVTVFKPELIEELKKNKKGVKATKTTDLQLYDIMKEKKNISNILIQAMKESAFDCNLYSKSTKVNCLVFDDVDANKKSMTDYAYNPDFKVDDDFNSVKKTTQGKRVQYKLDGQLYIAVPLANGDYELYTNEAQPARLDPRLIAKQNELIGL